MRLLAILAPLASLASAQLTVTRYHYNRSGDAIWNTGKDQIVFHFSDGCGSVSEIPGLTKLCLNRDTSDMPSNGDGYMRWDDGTTWGLGEASYLDADSGTCNCSKSNWSVKSTGHPLGGW